MDILKYLDKFEKFTKDPTLKAMEFIMQRLGNPEKNTKFIHVAGTNGKGSVCEMLSNVLVKQGYIVGKFITPHLIDFKEEISVNNINILDSELENIISELQLIIEEYDSNNEIKVKWFEVITSVALKYFSDKKCDIVVLETGLGGTTDCTNIVDSLISVICNIGYDHMAILGNTIEEISTHKAGIIKENKDTVFVYQDKVIDVIKSKCEEKNNKLHIIQKEEITNYSYNQDFQIFDYKKYNKIEINLKGKEQIYNAATCLESFEILKEKGYNISEENIRHGLNTVIHKARFEVLSKNPKVIFDGGHNENAIKNLVCTLRQYYENRKIVYILSIITTKDYKTIIKNIVQDKNSVIFVTDGDSEKGDHDFVPKEILYKEVKENQVYQNEIFIDSLENAINSSINNYSNDIICIAGSFYVYDKAKKHIDKLL